MTVLQIALVDVWSHRTVQWVERKDATAEQREAKQHFKAAILVHPQLPLSTHNIVAWWCAVRCLPFCSDCKTPRRTAARRCNAMHASAAQHQINACV